MRGINQAQLFEIGHDIAHRSRRQGHWQDARQIARADRLAGCKIALDDQAKDLARTFVELCETQLVRAKREFVAGQNLAPQTLLEICITPPPPSHVSGVTRATAPSARAPNRKPQAGLLRQ